MALNQFIASIRSEVAKRYDLKTDAEIDAFFIGMEESAKDNQEALEKRDKILRDTVAELCEAKQLLKVAVDDIARTDSCFLCKYYDNPAESCQTTDDCFVWRHADEAEKLLTDEK